MISYLTGKIIELDFTKLTILTSGGVGYDVGINELVYSQLSTKDEVELFVYHHITDNSQALFGFLRKEEKRIFEELIKISGVGGKVAQQILSTGIERLLGAIQSEDNKTIEATKGVGKKMAEKIIIELKDKDLGVAIVAQGGKESVNTIAPNLYKSIKATLVGMGYNPRDVDEKLSELPQELKDAANIIPYIIKELS